MKRIKFLFCIFAFFVVTFVSSVETQKLSGSGKDYLQQTEQGPWFTGSCELICWLTEWSSTFFSLYKKIVFFFCFNLIFKLNKFTYWNVFFFFCTSSKKLKILCIANNKKILEIWKIIFSNRRFQTKKDYLEKETTIFSLK